MKKLLFLGAIMLSAAAIAQAPQSPSASGKSNARAGDPNQTLCRRIPHPSSRLGRMRVCLTRQQWAERRSEDQANILRSQGNRSAK